MSTVDGDRRITGWSALVAGVASVGMVAMYFMYSGPPPEWNVLTRSLLFLASFTAFLVFAVGLGRLLRQYGGPGLAGELATAALRMYVAITLVASSLEVGGALEHPDGSTDPTTDGPLAAAMVFLHGPVARVLVATFLVALVATPMAREHFSSRVRTGSLVVALANLAMIPSIFFGMDAAHFYASNGWGAVATMGAVNVIWLAVLGRAVLGLPDPEHAARPTAAAPVEAGAAR